MELREKRQGRKRKEEGKKYKDGRYKEKKEAHKRHKRGGCGSLLFTRHGFPQH